MQYWEVSPTYISCSKCLELSRQDTFLGDRNQLMKLLEDSSKYQQETSVQFLLGESRDLEFISTYILQKKKQNFVNQSIQDAWTRSRDLWIVSSSKKRDTKSD